MKNIDLKKIIEELDLDARNLAEDLFPGRKHPKLALDRVVKGEAFLDSTQISKLSHVTGISIEELFGGGKWKSVSDPSGVITFTWEDYEAKLDPKTNVTKITHKGSLFHESVIHSNPITLSAYLQELNNLIK